MGLNAKDLPFDVPEVMEKGFFVTQVDTLMNASTTRMTAGIIVQIISRVVLP